MAELRRDRVDVLVVGGGLAAMQAAVSAAEAGVTVGVASKRRMGRSGSSAATTGGFAAVLPENEPDDTPDLHFEDTIAGSGGIADPELVRVLVDEAPALVEELVAVGGKFSKQDGAYTLSATGDHSRLRSLGAERRVGTDFTIPLAERAIELGVREFEKCMAVELLVDNGEAVGILAIDTDTAEPWRIDAGATILATGGAGQLYPVSSNPPDVTGDGFSLAVRAGARMRDMEFIQFYPWRCIDPFTKGRVSVQPATFTVGAKMYNARGERFMLDYAPDKLEATTRDISAIAIFDQMRQGLGVKGGVRLDLSDISREVMEETNPKLMKGLKRPGIDYRTYEFIVAPEAHYYMGGVQIDLNSMSTVPRLFAVGECAGGIQGGNRLSNNALPEAVVFGKRAALHAAELIRDAVPQAADDAAAAAVDRLERIRSRVGSAPEPFDRSEVQNVAQDAIGIIRHAESLKRGAETLRELRARWEVSAPVTPAGVSDYLALRSLLDTAEIAIGAATMRTESRAAHYRLDYPDRDDENWLGVIVAERHPDGAFVLDFVKHDGDAATATQE